MGCVGVPEQSRGGVSFGKQNSVSTVVKSRLEKLERQLFVGEQSAGRHAGFKPSVPSCRVRMPCISL